MTWRSALVVISILTISGCELIGDRKTSSTQENTTVVAENAKLNETFCISSVTEAPVEQNCNIEYWLNYWSDIENSSWPQRKTKIEQLGSEATSTLKKILLSQGKATPYQDRLRAQRWIESLLPKLSPQMRNFMSVVIYQPSQELLEMESALVSLSRINTDLTNAKDAQKLLLEKQKNQIEQLLKIEASIMNNEKGDKL
ncbi:hypothetical protein [Paraglaciecola sp.]|uniref:hypothetical protein n=1 Tax=Paraglaciecola sp. TaxID=1920173 RepID=UPI0030F48F5C